jgi:RimJ/RimL family protein N-acetyltransferase
VKLETGRLTLRPAGHGDLEPLVALYGDPEVMRFIGAGGPWPREQAERAFAATPRRWQLDGFGHFVVERRADGAFVGEVDLLPWDPSTWTIGFLAELGPAAEIEIGWTIAREHWGNGYATEAALAVRDWALGGLGLGRLISIIHPENAASIRVAEKLGERYERDVHVYGIDHRLYALTRSD